MQRDLSGNIPAPSMPRTCFLIGHPIGHSLSPVIHSAAYESLGMDWHYAVMDVLEENIDAVLAGIDGDKVVGINVTIPHKQAVFRRVDSLTDTARAVGAVNTVYRRDGKLVGDNTDVAGFMSPLHLLADRDWSSVSALILGAGGAARAVAHALYPGHGMLTSGGIGAPGSNGARHCKRQRHRLGRASRRCRKSTPDREYHTGGHESAGQCLPPSGHNSILSSSHRL